MRAGRSLQEIAAELERQVHSRKDYIAPQGALTAEVSANHEVVVAGLNGNPVGIKPYAHGQLAVDLGIPKQYYDRMLTEEPDLLTKNINTWLRKDPNKQRMVRTLDGKARAFLSPRFRPLDNFDLAEAVFPVLQHRGVRIMSAELTETKFYIKGILPELSDIEFVQAIETGEHINSTGLMKDSRLVAAVVISNSDVGASTLRVEPSVFTTRCTNLAIILAAAMKKYHVGRSSTAEESYEVFRDETRQQDDKAFWMKVRDVTEAAFKRETFDAAVAKIRAGQGQKITSEDLPKVVDVTIKRLSLPEKAGNSILTHLAKGGDLSAWGLSSAITATANAWDDYEGATDLEYAGGKVLALPAADWKAIAEAA